MEVPEGEKPYEHLTTGNALIALLISSPVYFLFAHWGRQGAGQVAALEIAIVFIAIIARWELRRHVWFWLVVLTLAVLHLPLVLVPHWNSRGYRGFIFMPYLLVDLMIYFGVVSLVGRMQGLSRRSG